MKNSRILSGLLVIVDVPSGRGRGRVWAALRRPWAMARGPAKSISSHSVKSNRGTAHFDELSWLFKHTTN